MKKFIATIAVVSASLCWGVFSSFTSSSTVPLSCPGTDLTLNVTVSATCSTQTCNLKVKVYTATNPPVLIESKDYYSYIIVYTFCIPTPLSTQIFVRIEKGEPSCANALSTTTWLSNFNLPLTGPYTQNASISYCLDY